MALLSPSKVAPPALFWMHFSWQPPISFSFPHEFLPGFGHIGHLQVHAGNKQPRRKGFLHLMGQRGIFLSHIHDHLQTKLYFISVECSAELSLLLLWLLTPITFLYLIFLALKLPPLLQFRPFGSACSEPGPLTFMWEVKWTKALH